MNSRAVRVAQVVVILVGGLTVARSAHAQGLSWRHWRNANTTNGTFYLGVSGGEVCNGIGGPCGLATGTPLVTWQQSGWDQLWGIGGNDIVQNDLPDFGGDPVCIGAQNHVDGKNANLAVYDCSDTVDSDMHWFAYPVEELTPPAPFPGCYVFFEAGKTDGTVMSVYQGVVKNGSRVVEWPLCTPNRGNCGSPTNAYHADQIWCPDSPLP
jgi:hypothetical protein